MNKIIEFLINYAGFTSNKAEDFFNELPCQAIKLAEDIKKSLLDDSTITEEFKNKIKEYKF